MLQAVLVIPTAKLDISSLLVKSSPSPPPPHTSQPPPFSRSISVPTSTSLHPLVSSPSTSTTSHFSTATAPPSSFSQQETRGCLLSTTAAPFSSSTATSAKRPPSLSPHPLASPAKKQSKWTASENALIVSLRGSGMKWDDISTRLPGRSAISCRLHYQNYLERKSEWDDEKKNKLARLYDRMKQEMWTNLARDLGVPWRTAEAMHWSLGVEEMAKRAGATPFTMDAARVSDPSSAPGGNSAFNPSHSPGGGGDGGLGAAMEGRSGENEGRGESRRRRRRGDGSGQGTVLPSLAELEGGVGVYDGEDEEEEEEEQRSRYGGR